MPSSQGDSVHIYVASHLPSEIPVNSVVSAVHAGAADSVSKFYPITDADTQDNISHLNSLYSELTVHYMLLASEQRHLPERIGFMHYRRFLDFSDPQTQWEKIKRRLVFLNPQRRFGIKLTSSLLEPKLISRAAHKADLVVPWPFDVRRAGFSSVRDQYISSTSHFESDWEICGSVIERLYPDLYAEWSKLERSYLLHMGNIYIMRKKLFLEYGEILFKILEQVRAEVNFDNRSSPEKRVLGYLAERIFTAFVGLKRQEGEISIATLPLILIKPKMFDGN